MKSKQSCTRYITSILTKYYIIKQPFPDKFWKVLIDFCSQKRILFSTQWIEWWGLCPEGLCPRGISVRRGSLWRGSVSGGLGGDSVWGGLCLRVLYPGSLCGGFSVQGVSVLGVSVQGDGSLSKAVSVTETPQPYGNMEAVHILLECILVIYFYHPQRSCGKVMFSQASVILFAGGGGCGRHTLAEIPPSWPYTLRASGRHPHRQTPSPTPPQRWLLQRTVSILLECILVFIIYFLKMREHCLNFSKQTLSMDMFGCRFFCAFSHIFSCNQDP